ncbi:MAG: hypothetical protein ACR2GP_08650 [Burkholderiaceae bacterium]
MATGSASKGTPGKHTDAPAPEKGKKDAPRTVEERIDESLEESFPASDPPAVHAPAKK